MTRLHPARTLRPRSVTVAVTLSLGAVLGLAGCGSNTSASQGTSSGTSMTSTPNTPSGTSSATTSSATGAGLPAGAKTMQVSIKGKQVTPAPGSVPLKVGQTLRLVVTSDHDDELHAHGFDKEIEIKAGQPATLDLVTTVPGTYEVETHHPPLRLLKVVVQ